MGTSQSTQRAAKFSGTSRRSMRACSAPSSATPLRRTASTNTNRAVKEFSKFWTQGGSFQPRASQKGRRSRPGSTRRTANGASISRTQSIERKNPKVLTPTSTPATSSPLPPRKERPATDTSYIPPGASFLKQSFSPTSSRSPQRATSFKHTTMRNSVPTKVRSKDCETII
ncbi:unnamed protein product, partial [Mesorhabditis belari]|uniref:Uncharacterized protein n=1 Tax=Mesorhabditis belari TaxID=2138241 RepID=A0AAF3FFL7_9BILA